MIIPEKKKTVSIILSKLKPSGAEQSADVQNEDHLDDHAPLKIIAEDMMLAFKNGSISGLQDALDALVAHVQSEDDEQDQSEEE